MPAEASVHQQQDERRHARRERHQPQHRGHDHVPREDRHPPHRHPRRAHQERRRDDVDAGEQGGDRDEREAQDPQVRARPPGTSGPPTAAGRRTSPSPRRRRPTRTPTAARATPPADEEPVRQRVQPRERHVGRADLQRDEVVAQARAERRHEQEDHHGSVDREQPVVGLGRQELPARVPPVPPASSRPAIPPTRKNANAVTQYMIPIRLWSVVVSHDSGPVGCAARAAAPRWRRPDRRRAHGDASAEAEPRSRPSCRNRSGSTTFTVNTM